MSFGDMGGAQALVIGFADPATSLELAREGLLVSAVVQRVGTVRRWRAAAKNALSAPALERFSVIAATPETLEAQPETYARVMIGPELRWLELSDPGAWLVQLISPGGELMVRADAGPNTVRRLTELVELLAADFRLLAVGCDGPDLIVRAQRCTTHTGVPGPEHALAELALVAAVRSDALQELIMGLRAALSVRDRLVLQLREQLGVGGECKRRELAALGPRVDRLATRIADSRRTVRADHEQLAAMLVSIDDLLGKRSPLASER